MNAKLHNPLSVFVSNGEIFIADAVNHRVRKLLRNGQIVSIAGDGHKGSDHDNGDGQLATLAHLHFPTGVVVSSSNQVYISEEDNHRIRKIDQRGIISTIAGNGIEGFNGDEQLGTKAMVNWPYGLFVTDDDEVLFCDRENDRVRKIDRFGIITTIAGTGEPGFNGDGQLATSAQLQCPTSVFQYRNEIYIADMLNYRIRKIDQNGIISTISGNKILPYSIFIHNDEVYFTDAVKMLFKILPNGTITTIAGIENEEEGFNGDDQLASQCKLNYPRGIFVDVDSQIYIADTLNNCIRRIDQNGMMRRVVGTGREGYSGDVEFDFEQYAYLGT